LLHGKAADFADPRGCLVLVFVGRRLLQVLLILFGVVFALVHMVLDNVIDHAANAPAGRGFAGLHRIVNSSNGGVLSFVGNEPCLRPRPRPIVERQSRERLHITTMKTLCLAISALVATMISAFPSAGAATIIDEWSAVEAPPPPSLQAVSVDPKTTALLVLDRGV
jgi:hypothetical protein